MRDKLSGITQQIPRHTVLFGGSFLKSTPGGFLRFSDPVDSVELRSLAGLRPFFRKLEEFLAKGFSLAGYIGYEAGYGFEPESFDFPGGGEGVLPLAWFGVYRSPDRLTEEESEELLSGDCQPSQPIFDLTAEQYAEKIQLIQEHIACGNVYQVNFTGRYRFGFGGDVSGLFARLLGKQSGAYSAWLNLGKSQVLSLSPELFFSLEKSVIVTRPMKGTAPRGGSEEKDRRNREWLRSNEKNRAENLMIVDLLRNDLGRICRPGTIETPELFVIETYPSLHQMVSAVRGELLEDCSLYDIFRALFPCGSVTGAPKIRSMQLIRQLEDSPRGVYTGAIGYMLPNGSMCFNVAIRTMTLHDGRGEYGAGGGIVWDSKTGEEFDECRLKAEILDPGSGRDFGIFETMLYNGSFVWLDEHLSRLRRSAGCLGFSCDEMQIRRDLESLAERDLKHSGRCKVRLELRREGRFLLSFDKLLSGLSAHPVRVCRASVSMPKNEPLRKHKTTIREQYDRLLQKAVERGYDEVVFCNEKGEVTEGAISNIIILKDGWYLTPHISSGLLNGIFRRNFLATRPNARETVLTIEDLEHADCFFICNSVRGLRLAELCEETV